MLIAHLKVSEVKVLNHNALSFLTKYNLSFLSYISLSHFGSRRAELDLLDVINSIIPL